MVELTNVDTTMNCSGDVANNTNNSSSRDDVTTDVLVCCFVCKHPMHNPVDIFKTRTAYSKTLVSCKLSRLVQTVLRPPGGGRRGRRSRHSPDVDGDDRASFQLCSACVELLNQVDECEIKLMALENEVKLKYKMPFPIEVHSRDDELMGDGGVEGSAVGAGTGAGDCLSHPGGDGPVLVPTGAGSIDDCGHHFNVISMGGTGTVQAADGSTIVLQTQPVGGAVIGGGGSVNTDGTGDSALMVYTAGNSSTPAVVSSADPNHHHQQSRTVDGSNDAVAVEALHYINQLEADAAAVAAVSDPRAHVIHLTDDDDPLAGMVDVVAQEEEDDEEEDDDDEEGLLRNSRMSSANSTSVSAGGGSSRCSGSIPRIFFCSDCDEAFVSLPHLRRHRLQHGEGKTFPCRFCRRTFATNIALHNHWNADHADRLKPCPYCSKRFINRSNLNQHMAIHRAPTFKCEFCNRQFRSKGDVRKHHVFRHNTVKDHRCSECDMSFKVNWLLTRHRLRVHGH